jgi:F-type H+-transporting ATPase subunit b
MFFLATTVEKNLSIFGLFEDNLLNWLVLMGFVIWGVSKNMPALFASRQEAIDTALTEAAQARQSGEAFLKEQQAKLANAEKEADQILVDSKTVASQMKKQIEDQTQKDLADFAKRIEHDIANERQLAITELRMAAAKASITLAQNAIPGALTAQSKEKLLGKFVDQLGSIQN